MQSLKCFVLLLTICLSIRGMSQNAVFITSGKIEFEKKLNLYDVIKQWGDDESWSDVMKKAIPKFKIDYYDLTFTPNKSLYKAGRDNSYNNKMPQWMEEQPGDNNVIESDLEGRKFISQKIVLGQTFLLEDSLRKIKWKITDETKLIAGFNCRRANAIIMDSIYVVAFYTDEILAPGGPESFTGLPGMILGLALPHEHVSWFATKSSTDGSESCFTCSTAQKAKRSLIPNYLIC